MTMMDDFKVMTIKYVFIGLHSQSSAPENTADSQVRSKNPPSMRYFCLYGDTSYILNSLASGINNLAFLFPTEWGLWCFAVRGSGLQKKAKQETETEEHRGGDHLLWSQTVTPRVIFTV